MNFGRGMRLTAGGRGDLKLVLRAVNVERRHAQADTSHQRAVSGGALVGAHRMAGHHRDRPLMIRDGIKAPLSSGYKAWGRSQSHISGCGADCRSTECYLGQSAKGPKKKALAAVNHVITWSQELRICGAS